MRAVKTTAISTPCSSPEGDSQKIRDAPFAKVMVEVALYVTLLPFLYARSKDIENGRVIKYPSSLEIYGVNTRDACGARLILETDEDLVLAPGLCSRV